MDVAILPAVADLAVSLIGDVDSAVFRFSSQAIEKQWKIRRRSRNFGLESAGALRGSPPPPAPQDFRPRGIGRAPSGGSGRQASADFACRASTPIARRIAAIAGSRSLQDNFPPAKAPNS